MKTVIKSVYLIAALSLTTAYADTNTSDNSNSSTGNTNTTTKNSSAPSDTSTTNTTNTTNTTDTNTTNTTDTNTTNTTDTNTSKSTSTGTGGTSSFLGDYQCQRVDSANNNAANSLSVSKTGDTYTLQWENSNGDPMLYGTGVMHPNMANVVASSFWDPRKPEAIGVQMIEIKPDGSLQSNWVVQSDNQVGSETCTRSK